MFVIKASTPEAMRNEIVKWLKQQASNHSVAARIASRKGTQHTELAKSQAYDGAAKFLEGCKVETISQPEIVDPSDMGFPEEN